MAKTLRSRVAAVAVAALGLGLMTAVPASASATCNPQNQAGCSSNADQASYQYVTGITLAQAASSKAVVGQTVRVNMGAATQAFTTSRDGVVFFAGYLSATPADSAAVAVANPDQLDDLCTAACSTDSFGGVMSVSRNGAGQILGETVEASSTDYAGYFTFTPDEVGTYTLTVFHDSNGDGNIGLLESKKSITITVVAPQLSVSKSSVTFAPGTGSYATKTSTGTIKEVFSSKTANANSGAPAADITFSVKDTANNALTVAVTATVSGPALLSKNGTRDGTVATSAKYTATSGDHFYVYSNGDGGKAVVTLTAVTAAGDSVVLGTATVSFYGAVAKLAATSIYSAYAVGADAAVKVVATDANGINVPGASVSSVATNATDLIIGWTCVGKATVTSPADGDTPGVYYCTPGTGTDKQGTGSFSFKSGTITSNAASVLVTNTSVATITVTVDKASYLPGSAVVMTITAKNKEGNPVADNGNYAGFGDITGAGLNITGVTFTPGTYNDMAAAGQHQVKFYAPAVDGDWVVTVTPASALVAAATVTVKVSPTPAVTDLQAKVAALTTSLTAIQTAIATLVASTSATLTVLTNKINKIMKKLKIK